MKLLGWLFGGLNDRRQIRIRIFDGNIGDVRWRLSRNAWGHGRQRRLFDPRFFHASKTQLSLTGSTWSTF